jgi:hypothetical protein
MPRILRRWDRWLLTNAPLIWRSRLLYFVVFSALIANALLFGLGALLPVSRGNVPTLSTMAMRVASIYAIGGLALVYWAYVQYRIPLHERRARTYSALGLIYTACIFIVLINPLAFLVPAVRRIAEVVPDAEFAEELAFHEAHHFWQCGETEASIDANRPRLLAALIAWNVGHEIGPYDIGTLDCGVDVAASRGVIDNLTARLDAVKAAKEFRAGWNGPLAIYLRRIPLLALVSALAGSALLIALVPAAAWRRRLLPESVPLPLRVRMPRPGWLHRLDRVLLSKHPLLWSLRLHTFGF